MLTTRILLGAVVATGGPAIASLTGDYFPASERGRVYAYILGGEIAGTAFGFIVCGTIASLISWQASFVLLAIPGFFLALELYRTVPEPLRGGQSRLEWGVLDLHEAAAAAASRAAQPPDASGEAPTQVTDEAAVEAARKLGAKPDPKLVLHTDPKDLGLVESVKYILSIPTNMLMIISSSLGYFYFSGLSTFALLFVRGHYHTNQAEAELVLGLLVGGALVGTLVSGRVTDVMLHRGNLQVRVWVPAICYLAAAVFLIPGFLSNHLTPAVWFDVIGAALLSAANPPLDAARLDIMPAGLWGRAESTRTVLRSLARRRCRRRWCSAGSPIWSPASRRRRRRSAPTCTAPFSPGHLRQRARGQLPAAAGDAGRRRRLPAASPLHLPERRRDPAAASNQGGSAPVG